MPHSWKCGHIAPLLEIKTQCPTPETQSIIRLIVLNYVALKGLRSKKHFLAHFIALFALI